MRPTAPRRPAPCRRPGTPRPLIAAVATCLAAIVTACGTVGEKSALVPPAGEREALRAGEVDEVVPLDGPADETVDELSLGAPASSAATVTTLAPTTTVATTTTLTPAQRFTVDPYRGLGAWIDVFDWTVHYSDREQQERLDPAVLDELAARGVRTLYLQIARYDWPADPSGIPEPDLLARWLARADAAGLAVVGWYLPTHEDPAADLRRVLAMAELDIDGVALDIESNRVRDIPTRNARLIQLVDEVEAALPGATIGAIVVPPYVTELPSSTYWPTYPWAALGQRLDVFLPMSYWTQRPVESGVRDGHTYIRHGIDRVRALTGRPDALVHPVGGIADASSYADVAGMVQAANETGAIGISMYDVKTSGPDVWSALELFGGD
ncbi:MAG: hypothetical protein S0880_11830 [Actinomycetota bacterium]|nr:hypothetical protein [Actinomycetota bacterium]